MPSISSWHNLVLWVLDTDQDIISQCSADLYMNRKKSWLSPVIWAGFMTHFWVIGCHFTNSTGEISEKWFGSLLPIFVWLVKLHCKYDNNSSKFGFHCFQSLSWNIEISMLKLHLMTLQQCFGCNHYHWCRYITGINILSMQSKESRL